MLNSAHSHETEVRVSQRHPVSIFFANSCEYLFAWMGHVLFDWPVDAAF